MVTEAAYPCVVCQRRLPNNGMVCDGCRERSDSTMAEIPDLYAVLPEHLERGQSPEGQRVSGSREAPLPLAVDPLDLSMPAPTGRRLWEPVHDLYRDQSGRPSVAAVLDSWARDWREIRDMRETPPEPTVVVLIAWLRNRFDWACSHHPAVDEYVLEVRQLHSILRAVVGLKSDRVGVGPCPVITEKGQCAAALTADPYLDAIRCPRCDTLWTRDKWLWLGTTIRAS
jgi:hypothetical protein